MNPNVGAILGVTAMLSTETSTASKSVYEEARPRSNPRMHHTKPHETTDEARKRKKAERQRKRKGRAANR